MQMVKRVDKHITAVKKKKHFNMEMRVDFKCFFLACRDISSIVTEFRRLKQSFKLLKFNYRISLLNSLAQIENKLISCA